MGNKGYMHARVANFESKATIQACCSQGAPQQTGAKFKISNSLVVQ